jgi:hypothetical protein
LQPLNSVAMKKSIASLAVIVAIVWVSLGAAPAPPVTDLTTASAPESEGPNLAVGPDGKVYLSWLEPMKPKGYARRFSVRGPQGWSAPKTISSGTNWFVSAVDFPSLAMMSDGTLAANWLVASNGPASEAYDINFVFSKDGGTTWSKPIVPHRDVKKRQHGFLAVVPTKDAKLAAIWLDGRNMKSEEEGDMALMYTTIASNGTLGPEMQIDNRTCECCKTALTETPDGLIAVYRDRSPKEIRDISVSRFVNGKWSPPQDLSKDGWEIDGCPINGPAVSSNGANVAVAWFTAPADKAQVDLMMSADGGKTFGKKIRVDAGNPAGRVEVLSLASGDAIVSWIERTAQGARLHLRRFDTNGNGAAPIDVSRTVGVRSGGFPKMVLSGNDIVVAWSDNADQSRVRSAVVSF